jgi:acyl-CoA reductase-like NAD-dependent aldehyde dehydrogenase
MAVQQTISPVDGSVHVERELATPEIVDAVLERAVAAQRGWRATPLDERIAVVERLVPWMVERAADIGAELSWQMGRPVSQSPGEITRGFQERATWLLVAARGALADEPLEAKDGFERFIHHEPLGVVLVVAPWSYPYLCSVNAVVPSLLAGNAVVLKAASQTPLVAERWAEGLAAAGLPDGLFQHVVADHDTVAGMVADPRVGYVAFTGSVAGGHAVQRAAASRFVGTGLELGGKDPAYVRADAPLEATVAELADGAFFNAGQSCCGIERIYVHRDRFDDFVDAYVELARRYELGNWTGVKDSGRGVSLSTLGFQAVTRPKSFHLRRSL